MCAILLSLPSRERGLKSGLHRKTRENPERSLPSRERGLKFQKPGHDRSRSESLPSRERGLKYGTDPELYGSDQSLPSRERGLKSLFRFVTELEFGRSPRGSVD